MPLVLVLSLSAVYSATLYFKITNICFISSLIFSKLMLVGGGKSYRGEFLMKSTALCYFPGAPKGECY